MDSSCSGKCCLMLVFLNYKKKEGEELNSSKGNNILLETMNVHLNSCIDFPLNMKS